MNMMGQESLLATAMHTRTPDRRRPGRTLVVATIVLWSAAWGLLTAKSVADGGALLSLPTALRAGLALFGCVLCVAMQQVLERIRFRTFTARMVAGAVLAGLAAEVLGWTSVGISWLVVGRTPLPNAGMTILILGFYAWVFFSWVTIYLALSYSAQAMDAERRAERATAEATAAQLRALRYQLNPHFLFNTLNSLSALILEKRTGDADRMVVRLSSFLRTSLSNEGLGMITAEEEVDAQRRYLEIEQVRFPDLTLRTEVDPAAAASPVPPLILQPLVENAIKFAVSDSLAPAEVSVSAFREAGRLLLTVSDSGGKCLTKPHGLGVGLRNVRERLSTLYGDEACLWTEKREGGGFRAVVSLPMEGVSC